MPPTFPSSLGPNPQRIKKRRNPWKYVLWVLVLGVFGVIAWIGITGAVALKNIVTKNTGDAPSFFGTLNPDDLTTEGDSRINILGIGVDSTAGLTDSIQIASIDPINNQMAMLSVPRDMYVKNPNGAKSKINEVYNRNKKTCAKKTPACDPDIDYGADALKSVLQDVLGIKIHYFAKVNFEGLKKIVDAVGGLDVEVKEPLRDSEYPCDADPNKPCGYNQPAGTYHMNGSQVLKYTRCRKGTCGDDFGRALRQQQIVALLQKKMLSAGVLSNPKKLTDLISIAGNHLRTDMTLDDMNQLLKIADKIDNNKNTSHVLDNDETGLLKAINNGSYLLVPVAGETNYADIRAFVGSIFPEPYVIKEAATIHISNASGKANLGAQVSAMLKKMGYNVTGVSTADEVQTATTVTKSKGKPYSSALLLKRFNASAVSKTEDGAAITVTLGSRYVVK